MAKDDRQVLLGTVRAIKRDRAVVRCADGSGFIFKLEGKRPALGESIIGRVGKSPKGGLLTLDLSRPEAAPRGSSTLSFFGDPTAAARLFKRFFASGAAAYAPGRGDTVRRRRTTGDTDLDWALGVFDPESVREGVALNVLDVRALAATPWVKESLSALLPSDTCDDPETTEALLACLRSGFSPTTRMILDTSLSESQESVDFSLPYNPLAGGWDWIRREGMQPRRSWPGATVDAGSARRLSAARQMALSFASRILPRTCAADDDDAVRSAWRRRLANAFACAAAALAWSRARGDVSVLETWHSARAAVPAALGEAASDQERVVVLSEMTAPAIRCAIDSDQGRPLLKEAAAIALATCLSAENPADRHRMTELAAQGIAAREAMFDDCDAIPPADRERRRALWLSDLADVMTHLGHAEVAMGRLATIGRATVPMGFQDVFDMEMEAIGISAYTHEQEGLVVDDFPPSRSM
jgi:hypothetical protein